MQALEPRLHPWHSLFLYSSLPNPSCFIFQIFLLSAYFSMSLSYHLLLATSHLTGLLALGMPLSLIPNFFCTLLLLLPTLDLSITLSFCVHTCESLSAMKYCFLSMRIPNELRKMVARPKVFIMWVDYHSLTIPLLVDIKGHIIVSTFYFNYKPCFIESPTLVHTWSFSPVWSPESGCARSKSLCILHFDVYCQIESIYIIWECLFLLVKT